MPYTVCGACSCGVGMAEMVSASFTKMGSVTMRFECHCGFAMMVLALPQDYSRWVNDCAELMEAYLDEVSVEELFGFWHDQAEVEPELVPVEAVIPRG